MIRRPAAPLVFAAVAALVGLGVGLLSLPSSPTGDGTSRAPTDRVGDVRLDATGGGEGAGAAVAGRRATRPVGDRERGDGAAPDTSAATSAGDGTANARSDERSASPTAPPGTAPEPTASSGPGPGDGTTSTPPAPSTTHRSAPPSAPPSSPPTTRRPAPPPSAPPTTRRPPATTAPVPTAPPTTARTEPPRGRTEAPGQQKQDRPPKVRENGRPDPPAHGRQGGQTRDGSDRDR
jgi:hypothetical protein